MPMVKSCHHIGIFIEHPAKLKQFYVSRLGFKFEGEREIEAKVMKKIFCIASACRLIRLRLEGVYLELFYPLRAKLKKRSLLTAGYNHWALTTANKTDFCRRAKDKGIRVIKVKRSGYYTYFIKDPEGNLIEIRDDNY